MKNLLFVDDEPRVLQGLERQLRWARREWNMSFFDGGAKALEFMAGNPVDVVVTDMMMPGMDGALFLSEVVKRHSNTVRIVLSGHAGRESVMRLVGPAHQYLSKPCDPEELRNAIARAFTLRDLLTNEKLKQLATRTRALPSLPALQMQLDREMGKDEPSIERVAEIISKDMAMTTKIMQLVNSAFFGLPQQISDTTEAVMYLGLATVRGLALSLQVFLQYDQKKVKGFSIDELSNHSWKTAVLARRIAQAEGCDTKFDDQCFLAGMLHDLGQLILGTGLPEDYARVLAAARENKQPLWQAERAEFGSTHADVGAYLLGLWGLPNPVVEAVAMHHDPSASPVRSFTPLVAVHVANAFAHEHAGSLDQYPGNQIDMEHLAAVGAADRLGHWRERCFDDGL